jgi:hypothetical protein
MVLSVSHNSEEELQKRLLRPMKFKILNQNALSWGGHWLRKGQPIGGNPRCWGPCGRQPAFREQRPKQLLPGHRKYSDELPKPQPCFSHQVCNF